MVLKKALFLGLIVSASGCGVLGPDDDEPLTVQVLNTRVEGPNRVVVTLKVTDTDEHGLSGLDKSNFALFQDDEPVPTYESATAVGSIQGAFSFHTGLLLDMSESVAGPALDSLITAASRFSTSVVGPSRPNRDLAVWWFDGTNRIYPLVGFTADTARITSAIRSLRNITSFDNSTDLHGAIIKGTEAVQTRVRQDSTAGVASAGAAVVFTDGTDRAQRTTRQSAEEAIFSRPPWMSNYTIGLGADVNAGQLRTFGPSGSELAGSGAELVGKFENLANQVNRDANSIYEIRYCSPARAGEHELKIEVREGNKSGAGTVKFTAVDVNTVCR